MAASNEFAAHCAELLSTLGPVRMKRMFGGHGYEVDGVFLALSIRDQLYLKADATTAPHFLDAGCQPFTYSAKDKPRVTMSYWTAPEDAMESPALMRPWARWAMEAALRARNAKPATRTAARRADAPGPVNPSLPPAPARRAATKKRATPAPRRGR